MDKDISAFRTVGERRYRETSGLYYEFRGGRRLRAPTPAAPWLETDNVWFTLLTMNTQQVHFDAIYAATTEWRKVLVDSTLTLAMLTA